MAGQWGWWDHLTQVNKSHICQNFDRQLKLTVYKLNTYTFQSMSFSVSWIRLSVVSVIISLISDTITVACYWGSLFGQNIMGFLWCLVFDRWCQNSYVLSCSWSMVPEELCVFVYLHKSYGICCWDPLCDWHDHSY